MAQSEPIRSKFGEKTISEKTHDPVEDVGAQSNGTSCACSEERTITGGEFKDEIFVAVRRGTSGLPLYATLATSACMVTVSILFLLRFVPFAVDEDNDNSNVNLDACSRLSHTVTPIWAQLIQLQIHVIQNLVHASLLGSAGMVAAFRGDAVWLFFTRNCAYYFGLSSISYLIADIVSVIQYGTVNGLRLRMIVTAIFTVCTMLALFTLDGVCRVVQQICGQPVQECSGKSVAMAQSSKQQRLATQIYWSARVVEFVALLYTVVTTTEHIYEAKCQSRLLEGFVEDQQYSDAAFSILPFEMSYSLGAHQSFLLSLFLLASTYPNCKASVGGAVLASSWRMLLAIGSIFQVSFSGSWVDVYRKASSIFFTSAEGITMIPILIAALRLSRNFVDDKAEPSTRKGLNHFRRRNGSSAYTKVESNDAGDMNDTDSGESDFMLSEESLEQPLDGADSTWVSILACPTLPQIAASNSFSNRQRNGALILWISTVILLSEMTVECFLALKQYQWDWNMTHEIYKWGMHVASMYLFCCIMCVGSPFIYRRARKLLALMSPTGSVIAIWQLVTLVKSDDAWLDDAVTMTVVILFGVRALCGIGQIVGLCFLTDTKPCSGRDESEMELESHSSIPHAKRALFFVYLPSMIIYGVGVAVLGNCSEPMISPTSPSSSCRSSMKFVLAQNWPGLGLFFHFGLLLIIFASDGVAAYPSYKQSLAIASLFSFHISLLLGATLIFLAFEHDFAFAEGDWIRIGLTIPWMASSAYLSLCLNKVWNDRIQEP